MKRTFYLFGTLLALYGTALMAAPIGKKKGRGRAGEPRAETALPADPTPSASPSWHTWTASSGETLEAKFRALENGILEWGQSLEMRIF